MDLKRRIEPDDAVDLHLHTIASDGLWTPRTLLDYLAERQFQVVAVTDHDTQRSVAEAMVLGEERGIRVIPGVEVTTRWQGRQWHVLVYGIDPRRTDAAAASFQDLLADLDSQLIGNAVDAAQRLEASGRPLPSLEGVRAGRPLWPFHVLSAAIKEGHFPGLKEAAETVASLGGSFTADVPLEEAVAAAHQAGGITVMAHPGRADAVGIMTESDLAAIRQTIPLDGLEAHYRSYTDAQTDLYRRLAAEHGMLVSSGSDSHGPGKPVDPRPWKAKWSADLLALLGVGVKASPGGEAAWQIGMDIAAQLPSPDTALTTADAESPEETLMKTEAELEAAHSSAG